MPYGFFEDPEHEGDAFLVHFDGVIAGRIRGSREEVEDYVARRNRETAEVQEALESDDRAALCRIGWHRQKYEDGTPLYFRVLPRLWGAAFGFALGPAPFNWATTKLADLGRAEPWFCEVCEEEIGA